MSTLMKNDKTIAGLVEDKKPIATFTLATGQIPLNNTQMETINGNWSVEDASIYSINGSTLTLLKDGVYLIENGMHGLVMPQSYIQTAAYVSYVGNAASGQVINGLEAAAIQGYSSSSYLRRLNAGTEITLRGYSSNASNALYGTNLSADNRMTVTKLE